MNPTSEVTTHTPTQRKRLLSDLPHPPALPIIGNLYQLRPRKVHAMYEGLAQKYGPAYTFRMGKKRQLVLSDTELIRQVLRARPHGFRRLEQIERDGRATGIYGVFHAEGSEWKKQRKLVLPAFGSGPTRASWDDLRTMCERLRTRFTAAGDRPVDVIRDLTRFTVDVTSKLSFGRDLNTLERGTDDLQRHIATIFATFSRRVFFPVRYWQYFKLPIDRRFERAVLAVRQEMEALIKVAHEHPLTEGPAKTLLEGLLRARDEDDPSISFSDEEVLGNVLTILFAGEDTTANTLAWMLYYLATDRGVLDRLRTEVDDVLGAHDSIPTFEDMSRMPITAALAKEVVRLRSPAPLMIVTALQDIVLGDITVTAGDDVVLLTRAADVRQLGEDGDKLQLDRWLDGAPKRQGVKEGLAFGDGPRLCPGRHLAFVECALVAALVAKHFELHLVRAPEEVFNFVMQPEGLQIRFTARE